MYGDSVKKIFTSIGNFVWKPKKETKELQNRKCRTTDELLEATGINKFTMLIILSMAFIWGLSSMLILAPAFIARDVSRICTDPPNCTHYTRSFYSVMDAFNLSDSVWNNPEWLNSAFFVGNSFGGCILSPLSDRIGRKIIVTLAVFFQGFFGVLCALSPKYWLLVVARAAQGFFFTSSSFTNFVIVCESVHNKYHAKAALIFSFFWVSGYLMVAPIAYLTLSWKSTMIAISLPSCLYGIFLWFSTPESLQYMLIKRQTNGAENWIKKAKKSSKKVANIEYDLEQICSSEEKNNSVNSGDGFWRFLFKNKRILLYLICLFIIWFVDFTVYNGMSYLSTSLNSDAYLAYILSGIVEVPSNFLGPYLLDKFGRKAIMILAHAMTGACLIPLIFLHPESLPHFIFWLTAKLSTTCCFITIFVYSSEVFPVEIRNTCLAVCALASNFGAIVAPHSVNLDFIHTDLAFFTFGVISLIATVLLFFLPETKCQKH